jgi:hypothetical protein
VLYSNLAASHQAVTGGKMADEEELFSESEKEGESEDEIVNSSPDVVAVPAASTTPAPSVNATSAASAATTAPAATRRILTQQPIPAAAGGAGAKVAPTPDTGADTKVKADNAGGRPYKVETVFSTVVKELGENSSLDVREKVQQLLKKEKILLEHIAPVVTYATDFVFGEVVSENHTTADLINKTIKKDEEKVVLFKHTGLIDGILIRNGALDWEVSCFMLFSKTLQSTPFFTHF